MTNGIGVAGSAAPLHSLDTFSCVLCWPVRLASKHGRFTIVGSEANKPR